MKVAALPPLSAAAAAAAAAVVCHDHNATLFTCTELAVEDDRGGIDFRKHFVARVSLGALHVPSIRKNMPRSFILINFTIQAKYECEKANPRAVRADSI
jgi:hypothetical protein